LKLRQKGVWVMSRAASRWIAPYWRARQPAIGDPIDSALVYVLNPSGHSSATVKRQWYMRDGSLLAEAQTAVSPSHTVPFSPAVDWTTGPSPFEVQGWMRITSDRPVCPSSTGQPDGHTQHDLLREDSAGQHDEDSHDEDEDDD
jgi:hypothetical protein